MNLNNFTIKSQEAVRQAMQIATINSQQAIENGQSSIAKILFEKAADYWKEAIRLAPTNYIEAQNWLKMTGRWNEG
jgi:hypothetical protein